MNKNQNYNQNIGTNDIFYRPPYTMNGTDDQCPGTAVCQQPRKGSEAVFDVTFLDVGVNCTEKCLACCLVTLSWFCATIFFPCGICSGMKCVNEYERLILYKFSQRNS